MMYRFPAAAAAAAFALVPLAAVAQDTQPPAAAQQPPVVDVPAPPAPAAPRAAPQRAPAAEAPADAGDDAPPPPPRVRTVRAAPARTVIVPTPVAAPATTTTTTTTAAPPVVATVPTVPPATVPATAPPDTLNAAPPAGVDTVTPPPRAQQPQLDQHTAVWPWFALGAVLLAAAALLLANRRRRVVAYDRQETYYEAPPARVAEVAVAPAVVPAAAPDPVGVPAIALAMRPLRAGVDEDAARVAFELTVDNRGTAEARDVRVTTWMLAAGASEAERALIEPSAPPADTPPLDIPAGESRMVEGQVALPRADIRGDALLPVVVADASYRLPDGSEARVSARFAVGVPDGEELAHFSAEHPSGLHEGVVAQTLGETERV